MKTRIFLFLLSLCLMPNVMAGSEDMTSKVSNQTTAWTNPLNASNHGEVFQGGVTMPERWFSTMPVGEIMSQSVDLPDGIDEAEVYCHGHVAWVTSPVTVSGATGYTTLSVNGVEADIPVILNTGWEAGEPKLYTLSDIPVVDGKMTFRLTAEKPGANWFTIHVKRLTRVASAPSFRYTIGDVNEDGEVTIADVTSLVNIILGKTEDYRQELADVNEDGDVTIADVTLLVNVVLGKQEAKVVDNRYLVANLAATIYAEQSATENAGSASYAMDAATGKLTGDDVSDRYDIRDYLTTLNIATSLPDVVSVSVYAKGKENIAGLLTYDAYYKAKSYAAGTTPSVYVNGDRDDVNGRNMQSDVVTVTGLDAGTYVAYLLPVWLSQGVTVTVRTSDGRSYSQDFADITVGAANNLTFTETTATNLWMATIPGNVNFSMLSTPGAHDAATSGVSGSLSPYAQCQSLDLAALLANGVRAFDLRPGYKYGSTITEDNLYIYHSSFSTGVLYRDAIKVFADFLAVHPSEAISIIMVKEDNSSGSDRSSEMWKVINAVHSTYGSYMKVLDHSYYTLDEFRGKMCYVNRTGTDCTNTVRITNWPDDGSVTNYSCQIGGTCYASVEDAYQSSGSDKQNAVKTLLDLASVNTNRARFHYTYTSVGSIWAGTPASNASGQNAYAADYITNSLTGPVGYVYGDFMGDGNYKGDALVKAVVEQNYKYVFRGRSRVE